MTGRQITSAELTTAQIDEVLALVEAARRADGVAPLSEHAMLHLRYDSMGQAGAARSGGRDFIVTANGEIAGYAYLDPASAEGEVTGGPRRPARGRRASPRGRLRALPRPVADAPLAG
jgi:mycothiol synthase